MQKLIHRLLTIISIFIFFETAICGSLFFLKDNDLLNDYMKDILIATIFILIVLQLIIIILSFRKISNAKHKTDISSLDLLGNDIQQVYDFGKIGVIIVDDNNCIVWTNNFFNSIQSKLIDSNIFEWEPRLKNLNDTNLDEMKLEINNVYY